MEMNRIFGFYSVTVIFSPVQYSITCIDLKLNEGQFVQFKNLFIGYQITQVL